MAKTTAPWADVDDATRSVMRGNRGRNTKPELRLRRALHAMGYRFRLHRRDLPGTPDIVFPSRHMAIQVHGCFWHQHEGCRHAVKPRTRSEYWLPKLARNIQRDRENEARLQDLGWRLLLVWECELADLQATLTRVIDFLGPPGRSVSPHLNTPS